MLLRRSMAPPKNVSYSTLRWEDVNQKFRDLFLSGGEYDTGILGAERLSPVAAAHRILCNDFGMIPFSIYQKVGDTRIPQSVPELDTIFKSRPNDNMTPYMAQRTVMSNAFWHGFGAMWNRRDPFGQIVERIPLPSDCCTVRQDKETGQYFYDYNVDGVMATMSSRRPQASFRSWASTPR